MVTKWMCVSVQRAAGGRAGLRPGSGRLQRGGQPRPGRLGSRAEPPRTAAELIASSPDLGVGLGRYLENMRESSDMAGVFLGILLILFVGIAIDQIVFSPLERWVLRSRGLSARSQ